MYETLLLGAITGGMALVGGVAAALLVILYVALSVIFGSLLWGTLLAVLNFVAAKAVGIAMLPIQTDYLLGLLISLLRHFLRRVSA